MSLLSETVNTVLQYNNVVNSTVRLGNPLLIDGGINYLTFVGKATPTEFYTVYPLLDVRTGKTINLKGLLVNNIVMESGEDGPLVANPPSSIVVSPRLIN